MSEVVSSGQIAETLKPMWKKLSDAVQLRNYEYAIRVGQNILAQEPGFLECRQEVRKAMIAKKANEGKKRFGLSSGGASPTKLRGKLKKDPRGALVDIESALEEDPNNLKVNLVLFDAAAAAGMPETAAFALETVRAMHKDETKALHTLAQHYLENQQPEKAADVFADIALRDPTDGVAQKGARDASAKASMLKYNWEGGGGRELRKDQDEVESLEAENRAARTRDQTEQLLAASLEKYNEDQNDLNIVKKIATLYEELEDFENALGFYEWAYSLNQTDVTLQRKIEEIRDSARGMIVRRLEAEIAAGGDEAEIAEKQAELDGLNMERSRILISEARDRVNGNPTDPQLRFELGEHLFNSGEFSDAIPELQRAKSNPHIRIRAIGMLAKCYEKKNMDDLAIGQFEEAIKEIPSMDGVKKDFLYNLAMVYEKTGHQDKYLEALKDIYNTDYGYRDVATRVEASYSPA